MPSSQSSSQEETLKRAATLVAYCGPHMAERHAQITAEHAAAVFDMIEASGQRIEDARTPTLADVVEALRDEALHDEACAYWDAPEDGRVSDHQRLGGMLTWLAEYLPQHIDEMLDTGDGDHYGR